MSVLLTEPMLATVDEPICIFAEPRPTEPEPRLFINRPEVETRDVTMITVMIVCGDCAGDDFVPRKTLLTADGCCDSCGGRSYVLAAELEIARRVARSLRNLEPPDEEGGSHLRQIFA